LSAQSSGFGIPLGIPIPTTTYFFNDGNVIWNCLCMMSWKWEPGELDDSPPKHVSLCPSHTSASSAINGWPLASAHDAGPRGRLRQPSTTDISVPRVERQRFGPSLRSPPARHVAREGDLLSRIRSSLLTVATLAPRNRDHAFKRNLILRCIPSVPEMRIPGSEVCSRADLAQ
jgi:hypothetical protein